MARKVMGALVAGALGTTPVLADVYESNVVQQLEAEGFRSISTERTWLGRMRIVAESGDGQREIIINPNNGEVLRDLWLVERRGGEGNVQGEAVAGAGSGQGAAIAASGKDVDEDNGGKSGKSDDRNDDRDRSWSKSGDGGGQTTGGGNGGRNGGDSDD